MSNQELERGNEIQREISRLKLAVHNTNKNDIFNLYDTRSCSGVEDDVFLSSLHNEIKTMAIQKINERVEILTKEFSML